jgi:hypothetical protein
MIHILFSSNYHWVTRSLSGVKMRGGIVSEMGLFLIIGTDYCQEGVASLVLGKLFIPVYIPGGSDLRLQEGWRSSVSAGVPQWLLLRREKCFASLSPFLFPTKCGKEHWCITIISKVISGYAITISEITYFGRIWMNGLKIYKILQNC